MPTIRFDNETVVWPPVGASFESINVSSSLDGVQAAVDLWTPDSGRRIVLMGFTIHKETSGKVDLKGSTRGVFYPSNMAAGENLPVDSGVEPFWVGKVGEKIQIDTTGLNGTFVTLWGHEE